MIGILSVLAEYQRELFVGQHSRRPNSRPHPGVAAGVGGPNSPPARQLSPSSCSTTPASTPCNRSQTSSVCLGPPSTATSTRPASDAAPRLAMRSKGWAGLMDVISRRVP